MRERLPMSDAANDKNGGDKLRVNGQSRVEKLRQSARIWSERPQKAPSKTGGAPVWRRQTWTLPREEARTKAREFLRKFPREAYWSEVENWRVLEGDRIEFTMRRLPTAD